MVPARVRRRRISSGLLPLRSPCSAKAGDAVRTNSSVASTEAGEGSYKATSNPARAKTMLQAPPTSPQPTSAILVMRQAFWREHPERAPKCAQLKLDARYGKSIVLRASAKTCDIRFGEGPA